MTTRRVETICTIAVILVAIGLIGISNAKLVVDHFVGEWQLVGFLKPTSDNSTLSCAKSNNTKIDHESLVSHIICIFNGERREYKTYSKIVGDEMHGLETPSDKAPHDYALTSYSHGQEYIFYDLTTKSDYVLYSRQKNISMEAKAAMEQRAARTALSLVYVTDFSCK